MNYEAKIDLPIIHGDVMTHIPHYWPFVWEQYKRPVHQRLQSNVVYESTASYHNDG